MNPGANACATCGKGIREICWDEASFLVKGEMPSKEKVFFPSYFSFSGRGLELCLIETKETRIRVHKKSNRSCLSPESTGRG